MPGLEYGEFWAVVSKVLLPSVPLSTSAVPRHYRLRARRLVVECRYRAAHVNTVRTYTGDGKWTVTVQACTEMIADGSG